MRTPGNDRELAAGFLVSEGITGIESITEDGKGAVHVKLSTEVDLDRSARNFYMTSSCGICGKASIESLKDQGCAPLPQSGFTVASSWIASLPGRLREAQPVFARTGGLHAAGLFDGRSGDLLLTREDVGRHNAVDKIVGAAFLAGLLPLEHHVLCLSGRISFELVQKALMAGIPIVAAVGAPSSLAVETARRFGITLAGFVRDGRFNLYSLAERVE